MIRKILTILSFFTIISVSALHADQKKIGFIYIGPPGDHGWTYMHDQGRIYMENALGDSISTTYIENVPENADAVRAIRKQQDSREWIMSQHILQDFMRAELLLGISQVK